MRSFIRFVFIFAALYPAKIVLADDGSIEVFVAGRWNYPAGRKISRATPARPVYYLPVFLGYREAGYVLADYIRQPPPRAQIEEWVVKALAAGGYRIATKLSPPSIAITVAWGYTAEHLDRGGAKERYFLDLDAIDLEAYKHHEKVELWSESVLTPYWGHYIDEVLPALIATGVPLFGVRPPPHPHPSYPVVKFEVNGDMAGWWKATVPIIPPPTRAHD